MQLNELLSTYNIRNFSAGELIKDHPLPDVLVMNIIPTVTILQSIRDHLGWPVAVNSGYRPPEYNKKIGLKAFYGFASDQSPQLYRAKYWDNFMGHEVPVYTGAEMLAKKLDMNMKWKKRNLPSSLNCIPTNMADMKTVMQFQPLKMQLGYPERRIGPSNIFINYRKTLKINSGSFFVCLANGTCN